MPEFPEPTHGKQHDLVIDDCDTEPRSSLFVGDDNALKKALVVSKRTEPCVRIGARILAHEDGAADLNATVE